MNNKEKELKNVSCLVLFSSAFPETDWPDLHDFFTF